MDWLMNIVGDVGNWIAGGAIGTAAVFARNWVKSRMSKDTKNIVSRFLHVAKNADEVADTATAFDNWWNKRDNTSFEDVVNELEDCRVLLRGPSKKQKQNNKGD